MSLVVGLLLAPWVLAGALWIWFAWIVRRRRVSFVGASLAPMPGWKPTLWSIGNLRMILKEGPLNAISRLAGECDGPCFVLFCGTIPHVVPRDPDAIREVLLNADAFVRDGTATDVLFRKGLLTTDGEPWRARRQLMNPAFQRDAVTDAVPVICDEVEALLATWQLRSAAPFSPHRDISTMMLRILGRFTFGFEFDAERHGGRTLHRSLARLTQEVVRRHFAPFPYWKLWRSRHLVGAQAFLDGVIKDVLTEAQARRRRGEGTSGFLELLLDARATAEISDADVHDEVLGILVAGHETSATALSWVLALLAKHSEVQARCHAEVDDVLRGRRPTMKDIETLGYVGQTIKETMRLYPPVPMSIYRAVCDTDLGGHRIPAGTRIDVLSYVTHRDPHLWSEPLVFDPSRFAPERARAVHACQYFPFLVGRHSCIGVRLAMLELMVATVLILQRTSLGLEGTLAAGMRVSLHPSGFQLVLSERPRQQGSGKVKSEA